DASRERRMVAVNRRTPATNAGVRRSAPSPDPSDRGYFCDRLYTYAATALISAADRFAPPIGGIGAGYFSGLGTPAFTIASIPASVPSVLSHSPSVRSGASGVPLPAGPWHV